MILADWLCANPPGCLAVDEALVDFAEELNHPGFLRFWESPTPFVVLGYGKKAEQEVRMDVADNLEIPILRRCTGGGTVLQGPGCLNYALILPVHLNSALETITGTNHFIMDRQLQAIKRIVPDSMTIAVQGHTDLTCHGLKFSGNAQRRKRTHLLFHGSFLIDYDLGLIEQVLKMPAQQPEYRQQRSHQEFIQNLPVTRQALKESLSHIWGAQEGSIPFQDIETAAAKLCAEKYDRPEWNLKF